MPDPCPKQPSKTSVNLRTTESVFHVLVIRKFQWGTWQMLLLGKVITGWWSRAQWCVCFPVTRASAGAAGTVLPWPVRFAWLLAASSPVLMPSSILETALTCLRICKKLFQTIIWNLRHSILIFLDWDDCFTLLWSTCFKNPCMSYSQKHSKTCVVLFPGGLIQEVILLSLMSAGCGASAADVFQCCFH